MNTDIIIKEPDIDSIRQKLDALVIESLGITVQDANSQAVAARKLNEVKDAIKAVDSQRHSWTDPLEAQKKRFMGVFNPVTDWLNGAKTYLERQLTDYFRQQEAIRIKEEERLRKLQEKRMERAEAAGKPMPLPVNIIPHVGGIAKSTENLTYIKKWRARVVDVSKLPSEYMLPNYQMLDDMARASKGINPPVGVEFYEEISTRSK